MGNFSCRALGAVLLAFAVSCSTLGPSHRDTIQVAYNQAVKTVLVAQETVDGSGHYIGSAFLIRVTPMENGKFVGLFMTAKHVVDLSTKTTVVFFRPKDPNRYYARVQPETIKRHPLWDAAVFKVSGLPAFFAKPLPLTKKAPSIGDWVLSYGYTSPDSPECHTGNLTGSAWIESFGPCLVSNAKTLHGMSGGPVLNKAGKVIGITVAKNDRGDHFAVSVHALDFWLLSK